MKTEDKTVTQMIEASLKAREIVAQEYTSEAFDALSKLTDETSRTPDGGIKFVGVRGNDPLTREVWQVVLLNVPPI